jgi:uncharacterized membrane protein
MHAPLTSSSPQFNVPVFTTPVRWTLRVLAWVAFGTSAYLAWHAVTATQVAGCGVGGDSSGCDMVLASSWSKWLGMPVAVPGLACYATLATLSVLLGRTNARTSRWINTAFLMLAALAAVASLWFLGLQVFVIGHFCPFCIVTDLCGIALGAIAIGATAHWLHTTRYTRRSRTAATGLMALRTALPAGSRTVPVPGPRTAPAPAVRAATVAVPTQQAAPSLLAALGGAGAIALLLLAGQILFPSKGYEVQKVALSESIELDAGNGKSGEPPPEGDERVAMRLPTEPEPDPSGNGETADENAADSDATPTDDEQQPAGESESNQAAEEPPPVVAEPARQRLVKFLGGKLTLDVYKHPLIGSPEAPHVLVEMVSYDCKHCRKTHGSVKRALARYGNQVAIILMVIPLDRECNKLVTSAAASHRGACATARTALGVAAIRPSAFAKFHDWLMADEEKPPGLPAIIARAYGLVDSQRLQELSESERLKKQIDGYVNLFGTLAKQNSGNKEFGLPVQILGDHIMTGTIEKPADLYKAWEEHLGVKPR